MEGSRYSTSELAALLLNHDFEPEPVDVKERLARIIVAEPRLKGVGKTMVVTTVDDMNQEPDGLMDLFINR